MGRPRSPNTKRRVIQIRCSDGTLERWRKLYYECRWDYRWDAERLLLALLDQYTSRVKGKVL